MKDTMRSKHFTLAAISLIALFLGACNKAATDAPVPMVKQAQTESGAAAGSTPDKSVPAADSVMAPAVETKADPQAGRSNRAMSPAQESSAMPMPGQNNDHSAALTPAKPASGP